MKKAINFQKIGLLIRLEASERWSYRLTKLLLIAGVMVLLSVPFPGNHTEENIYSRPLLALMFPLLIFTVSILSEGLFSRYKGGANGPHGLMIPANNLEKFLSVWIFNLAIILLTLCLFWGMYLPAEKKLYLQGNLTFRKLASPEFIIMFSIWGIAVQSFTLWGSVFFKEHAYFKTLLSGIAVFFACYFINKLIWELMGPYTGNLTFNFKDAWGMLIEPIGDTIPVTINKGLDRYIRFSFPMILAIGFWISAYFRLEEMEIQNTTKSFSQNG